MPLARPIKTVVDAIVSHFTDERKLDQQFAALRKASSEVTESKQALDRVIAHKHNEDQFQMFADGARKARF